MRADPFRMNRSLWLSRVVRTLSFSTPPFFFWLVYFSSLVLAVLVASAGKHWFLWSFVPPMAAVADIGTPVCVFGWVSSSAFCGADLGLVRGFLPLPFLLATSQNVVWSPSVREVCPCPLLIGGSPLSGLRTESSPSLPLYSDPVVGVCSGSPRLMVSCSGSGFPFGGVRSLFILAQPGFKLLFFIK